VMSLHSLEAIAHMSKPHKGIHKMPHSVSRVSALPMATASRRIVLVLGMSAFLIAMLVCWPGGSRSAWAQNDPAAPTTYNFRVDQLEVEAKQGDKPATLVTVRNGDDQDDDLEFTAEVQGGGGISDPESSTTAEDGSAEAQ
jgi:hypothetical protein